jgi:5-(carboxyamino)imidazole ribonucleotide synthase
MKVILPGSNLGLLGSGQLGRMFAISAIQQGYTISCYSPEVNTPASGVGVVETAAEYQDVSRLENFLYSIDALTFEFENIPTLSLNVIDYFCKSRSLRVAPSTESIRIAQNRTLEKDFFRSIGLETTNYISIKNLSEFDEKKNRIQYPAIIKTNLFGYDGKGQKKVDTSEDAEAFLKHIMPTEVIIEEVVNFSKELSVMIARFYDGTIVHYEPSENFHKNHILNVTVNPASISSTLRDTCVQYAKKLVTELNYVGVLGLEFFLVEDTILCNEFAPRPHNSGHFSINSASLSQFDLQVRTLCNIPTNSNIQFKPSIMKNIMGEDMDALPLQIEKLLQKESYYLHLYGKREARQGRKMGHWNYVGDASLNLKTSDLF